MSEATKTRIAYRIGYVHTKLRDCFSATMTDVISQSHESKECFDFEEMSESDRDRIHEGGFVTQDVWYSDVGSGRERVSQLSEGLDLLTISKVCRWPGEDMLWVESYLRGHENQFILLQKWEGVVLSVEDDFFHARLVDLTNHQPDEGVEIPRGEVSYDDESLLTSGATFHWSIGYSHVITGGRVRISKIRFRRPPVWSENDIERSQKRAGWLLKDLGLCPRCGTPLVPSGLTCINRLCGYAKTD